MAKRSLQGAGKGAADGADTGLGREAMKAGAQVGDVESDSNGRALDDRPRPGRRRLLAEEGQ
jgi:hypothetical protein